MRWLVALALVACGDNLPDPGMHGGSRLRLIHYVYDDGTREWDREVFYDALRQERCRPQLFAEGTRHCVPEAAGGSTVFVDADCTRVLGTELPDRPPPPYFIRTWELHGKRLPTRIYPAGERVEPPAQVWSQQDGFCLGPVAPEPLWYYAVGEELGPDDLARVREVERIEGQRLALGVYSSDDGLHVAGGFYDRLVEEPCTLRESANANEAVCVPEALPLSTYYLDAACTQPVIALPAGTTTSQVVHEAYDSGCWSLLTIGAPISPPTLYEQLGDACVEVPRPSDRVLRAVAATTPIASAERLVANVPADRRLAPVELVDGPVRVPAGTLFDREHDAECRRRVRDGEVVCVPVATVAAQNVFADPSCSTPAPMAFVRAGACRTPPRFARDNGATYPVWGPYTLPIYELEPGDRCGTIAAPPGYVVHALGPLLSQGTFAHATIEIE